ncbi:MAG: Na+/H+ antiporter subunit E, partial [Clostridia bacterium]|nr:Na+/H+ antiporter subunit E [Clostridia bacterium]
HMLRFKTGLKTDDMKVLVANSITLTPGTFTVVLEDDRYAVHALDVSFNDGQEDNVFFQMAGKLEG